MSDLQMWTLIVGFLAPLVISVVQQPRWPNAIRVPVMVLACVVFGGGTAYFEGQFTGRGVVSCALLVIVVAITTYHAIWKATGVASKIEAVTSPPAKALTLVGPGGTEQHVVDPAPVDGANPPPRTL